MTLTTAYCVPAKTVHIEYEIKKSRFIGFACNAATREQAMAELEQIKKQFPDARHHCWAYQIGPPHSPTTMAMNDDGEPSGTAGKPILNVLQHKNIGDILVVVVRYFGGIKLGAGGLVRAYSHTTQLAVDALELKEKRALIRVVIRGDFALEQILRHWLALHEGNMAHVEYGASDVAYTIELEEIFSNDLTQWLIAQNARIEKSES